jgi:hypothetical protein
MNASRTLLLAWTGSLAVFLALVMRTQPMSDVTVHLVLPAPRPVVSPPGLGPFVVTPPAVTPAAAAPPAHSARPACPPPNRDAPSASSLPEQPFGMHQLVAAHTNASWVAAWNDDEIQLSIDGGLSYARVLDGPGAVRAVTFDCFGRAIAFRGEQLGIRDGRRESWRAVPGVNADADAPIALVGGGPDVIVVGTSEERDTWQARLAVTGDLGASWWFRDLVDYWETGQLDGRQDPDGAIHLVLTTADCMSDPVSWIRIRDGKVADEDLGSVGVVRLFGDIAINAGWHGVRWKRFGEADWTLVQGLPDESDSRGHLYAGPLPRVIVDGVVYAIEQGRAVKRRTAPGVGTVDRAGRLWILDDFESDTPQIIVR